MGVFVYLYYMKIAIVLLFISCSLYSQERKDLYYFSITGDTILFPTFSVNDSTTLRICKIVNSKLIEIDKINCYGFYEYSIPNEILKKYGLLKKGTKQINERKNIVYVKEKVKKNEWVGWSIDGKEYLYYVSIKVISYFNNKKVSKSNKFHGSYYGLNKKELSKESFFTPIIIKMEGKDLYFITLSVPPQPPFTKEDKMWSIHYDLHEKEDFYLILKKKEKGQSKI